MSARTANERNRSAGKAREIPEGASCRTAEASSPAAQDALRAAWREVSTGTN